MAKNEEDKGYLEKPHGFPDNVDPSPENIKAFRDQQEYDQARLDDGKGPDYTEERIGEGLREIPVTEREPEASEDGKSQVVTKKADK